MRSASRPRRSGSSRAARPVWNCSRSARIARAMGRSSPTGGPTSYPRFVTSAAVLVVDDDGPIRRMLERTLSADGLTVSAVPDGGAALAAVERDAPDLVVLDIGLPGLDGLAVCRRLR